MDIKAIRKLLDLVREKFGKETIIEIYSDGSGFIRHDQSTKIDDYLLDFTGLGELAEELS